MHDLPTNEDPTFCLDLKTNELYRKFYMGNVKKKSCVASIYKSKKVVRNHQKGVFLTHINDVLFSSKPDSIEELKLFKDRGW